MLDTSQSDGEKFLLQLSDLIVTAVNPTSAPENIIWFADRANLIRDLPHAGLPGDYLYGPAQIQEE